MGKRRKMEEGLIAALMLLAGAAQASATAPQATTQAGVVEGVAEQGVAIYRGIPFAAPPVGPDRWRAPQPFPAWQGVRPATAFGHNCWQSVSPKGFGPWTHEYVIQGDISEDCLFLNVWTGLNPAPKAEKRPVLVWVHGGGFNSGSGSIPIYDGAAFARRGIVVVTINYRVGVFGFLAHPELSREAAAGQGTNFGLLDMVAALQWVRGNIAAFGGDPAQVTIAGQSAGAMAVQELAASPLARGLFQRAIAESGLPRQIPALGTAEQAGLAFQREKGAASLAALRAMPADALQPAQGANAVRFGPVADGVLLPAGPWQRRNAVPMLAGFVADEASAQGPADYGSPDAAKLSALLKTSYGGAADAFAPLYPAATDPQRAEANRQIRRDRAMAGLYAWSQRAGGAPTYAYLFTHVMPGATPAPWGAFHSSEIPYVFQTFGASPERPFTATDQRLSAMLSAYWVNFIATGDPNRGPASGHLPLWPALDAGGTPQLMRLDEHASAQPVLGARQLALTRADLAAGGLLDAF